MNPSPQMLFDEKSLLRLGTIANSTDAKPIEIIEALIYAAYFRPHSDWNALLKTYREAHDQPPS